MALGDFDSRWKNPQGADAQLMYLWAQDLIKELRKGDYIASGISSGVPNSDLADMAAWTIKMRNSAVAGDPQDQTINQLTTETSVVGASDFFPMWDTSAGTMDKATPDNIVAGLTSPPGMRLLNSGVVANAAALDIVLTSFTSSRALRFVLESFVPATDDVELWMRVSTNGGSSYDAGGADYSYAVQGIFNNGTSASRNSTGAAQIVIAGFTTAGLAISNVAAEGGVHAEISLYDQTAAQRPRALYAAGFITATATNSDNVIQSGCGGRLATQDTDAVQFLFESGNITSGKWALYGYA